MMSTQFVKLGMLLATVLVCWEAGWSQSKPMSFRDVLQGSDIQFVHTNGSSGQYFVVEAYGSGLALLDYDGDGLHDIYFVNGATLPGTNTAAPPRNALYKNNGDWTFTDVTREAQVGDTGYGLGVVAGDYNNDGAIDLYVTNFGPNVFYANNGDGTFRNATLHTQTGDGERFSAGAAFVDIDADGDLDLFSGNYQKFSFDQHIIRTIGSHQFHPGPLDYPPDSDSLFRNEGDGTFVDISIASGIASVASTSMGVIATDFDNDGDMDIAVANDTRPNFLYVNDGQGNFAEQAVFYGFAYDRAGRANGSMGIDAGDTDGDGQVDLLLTNYQDELPVLYRATAEGFMNDATNLARIDSSLFPHVNWGVGLIDFDNDGDRDAFIACGHFMDNVRFIDDRTDVNVRNYLLENDGKGRFRTVNQTAGTGLALVLSSRGAAFDDLDNDGDIDCVVLNANSKPSLLRNETPAGHWLDLELIGTTANRSAVGARATLTTSAGTQTAEVYAGRSYQSHYGTRLHFGVPDGVVMQQLVIKWPNGRSQTIDLHTNSIGLQIVVEASE